MNDGLQKVIGSLVRHGMTALSGFLVAKGAVSAELKDAAVEIGVGLVVYGAAQIWSLIQKKKKTE